MKLFAIAFAGLMCNLTGAAQGQRLVSVLSEPQISIDSSFVGETLTLFGNVEPATGADQRTVEGPFQIIVVVRGPLQNRVARRKNLTFGLWINTEEVLFQNFPSYFHVLSSTSLEDITSLETLQAEAILPATRATMAAMPGQSDEEQFGRELIRLMSARGLFSVDEHGVQFRSNTLYSARLSLPGTVSDGNYLAETYLFKNGEIVSHKAEAFRIRKTGFERFLGNAASEQPFLYGLACVLLAVGTGWLGGAVFKR